MVLLFGVLLLSREGMMGTVHLFVNTMGGVEMRRGEMCHLHCLIALLLGLLLVLAKAMAKAMAEVVGGGGMGGMGMRVSLGVGMELRMEVSRVGRRVILY